MTKKKPLPEPDPIASDYSEIYQGGDEPAHVVGQSGCVAIIEIPSPTGNMNYQQAIYENGEAVTIRDASRLVAAKDGK